MLQAVLEDVKLLHWRRVEDIFKTTNVCWDYVSFEKLNSRHFGTLIGISPAAPLSKGKFSTTFLTVALETYLKKNFLFLWNFC